MSQCSRCLLDLNLFPAFDAGTCPNCGRKPEWSPEDSQSSTDANNPTVAPIGPGTSYALFSRFWRNLRDIIFSPAEFFRSNSPMFLSEESLSSALAFAVIVQWLASFFNFIWRLTVGAALEARFDDLFRIAGEVMQGGPATSESLEQLRGRMIEFLFGAGAIVLTPFTTLLKLAFGALLVHAAVRFFIRDELGRPHRYATTLKILAYATAPWILCIVPGVGVLLAYVLSFTAATIGLREVYKSTTARAMLAVAFPELLLLVFFFGMFVLFLFLAFNVLRLVF